MWKLARGSPAKASSSWTGAERRAETTRAESRPVGDGSKRGAVWIKRSLAPVIAGDGQDRAHARGWGRSSTPFDLRPSPAMTPCHKKQRMYLHTQRPEPRLGCRLSCVESPLCTVHRIGASPHPTKLPLASLTGPTTLCNRERASSLEGGKNRTGPGVSARTAGIEPTSPHMKFGALQSCVRN